MQLSRDLTSHEQRCIANVINRNTNLFAWQPSDMLGIHPTLSTISSPSIPRPNQYHKRRGRWEKNDTKRLEKKVNKLLKANFIREVRYFTWFANIIMVKKANCKWEYALTTPTLTGCVLRMHTICPASIG